MDKNNDGTVSKKELFQSLLDKAKSADAVEWVKSTEFNANLVKQNVASDIYLSNSFWYKIRGFLQYY